MIKNLHLQTSEYLNMSLDRQFQLNILKKIAEEYPFVWQHNLTHESDEYIKLAKNLHYLKGHELISESSTVIKDSQGGQGGGVLLINKPKITEKGLDFLQDDGGLSAILNTVTVKFEADTLKALLTNQISQSDLPPENKKSMIAALEDLPAESIKHLTMKLLDEGLENLPNALLLIGTYLGVT